MLLSHNSPAQYSNMMIQGPKLFSDTFQLIVIKTAPPPPPIDRATNTNNICTMSLITRSF